MERNRSLYPFPDERRTGERIAVSQMEATYYQVQGSVLDLQQQINQVENSLLYYWQRRPATTNAERWQTNSFLRTLP